MVFFVCEGCNETVKKNQVDKHAQRCRVCQAVTCVDCSVTFYGNDYAAHITCVSEAEKYEKTLYKGPKVKANPQDAWMLMVNEAVSNASSAPPAIETHLKRLNELTNIPRHEKKFVNFVKNSLHLYNDTLIGDIWKFLESYKTPHPSSKSATTNSNAPSSSSGVQSKSKEVSIPVNNNNNNNNTSLTKTVTDESETLAEDSIDKKKKKKEEKKRKRELEAHEAIEKEIVLTAATSTNATIEDEEIEVTETDENETKKKKKKDKKKNKNKEMPNE